MTDTDIDTARQVVFDHALLTPTNPHDGLACAACWSALGEAVSWPCAPLRDVAEVEPVGGGWTITIRPADDAARPVDDGAR
ncbi:MULTISPECIES: hypothetical protein [Streptomycetaceae]|uniref:hypothetical protein n=1 Tax=Streptomycetaceae TaxID=2062 RepID=UPI00093983D7|nr:hypothetical protein [Streptomyces sp. CB02056]OKI08811.1 hypothetical protein AMK13_10445 [Streptomyces sp. CB02056]